MVAFKNIRRAWNVFRYQEEKATKDVWEVMNPSVTSISSSHSPTRTYFRFANERSIVTSIYTRMSVDLAGLVFRHVRVDDDERYKEDVDSMLNGCFLLEPNIDQGPRQFRQNVATALFDKGVVAIVPVDTTPSPVGSDRFDITQLRVGDITEWFPTKVRVSVWNQEKGIREDVILDKKYVAIVENPFYSVMNEPNSTLQRLIRKLGLLDSSDEKLNAGKLDIIIQLPYVIKSEARKIQAEERRQAIEDQIVNSPLGIAYTDGTEKITQLNRPVENNLLKQVELLMKTLYEQLGITNEILNGTADEATMLNYYTRTIEPIADVIVEAMQRSFIGPVGYLDNERIIFTRDPFKLVPISQLAEIGDKFTRNEILTSNEVRAIIARKPVDDPKANQLINSNMPSEKQPGTPQDKQLEPVPANPQRE